MRRRPLAGCLGLVTASILCAVPAPRADVSRQTQGAQSLAVDEQMIAAIGNDAVVPAKVSPAGDRVAWRVKRGGRWAMLVNGEPYGPGGDGMGAPLFSADGKHLAFAVLEGGTETLYVDAVARGVTNGLTALLFSPDGESMAWVGCRRPDGPNRQCRAQLLGGEPGPEFAAISGFWIRNGTPPRLAYDAYDDRRWVIVVDGKEYSPKTYVKEPGPSPYAAFTFGTAGPRFFFVTHDVGIRPVVDGRADLPLAAMCGIPRFSDDGERLAYAVVEFEGHQGFAGTPEFHGRIYVDGKQVAAAQTKKGRHVHPPFFPSQYVPAVANGLDPAWAGVTDPVFSPNGKRVAWGIKAGDRAFRVDVDGVAIGSGTVERLLAGPVFSRDGARVAYVGQVAKEIVVLVDGAVVSRLPGHDDDFAERLMFSPDGQHVAFVLGHGDTAYWERDVFRQEPTEKRRVVLDGVAGPEFDAEPIARLLFSDDSRHLSYVVYVGTHGNRGFKSVVVLDGQVSPAYAVTPQDAATILFWDTLRFVGPDRVTCTALKEQKFLRATFTAGRAATTE